MKKLWQRRIRGEGIEEMSKGADQSVAVLSRKHLIQNKRASGRIQDLADVEWLETRGSKRRLRGRRPTSR